MKSRFLFSTLLAVLLPLGSAFGQNTTQLIAQGRAQLVNNQFSAARDSFIAAANITPTNAEAQTLAAGTEWFALWESSQFQTLLTRAGFEPTGGVKDAKILSPDGDPVAVSGANLNESQTFEVNTVLPVMQDINQRLTIALANNPGLIHLSLAESGSGMAIDFDQGDLLIIRAIAQALIADALLSKASNMNVPLAGLYTMVQQKQRDAEHFRRAYPNFFARPAGSALPADLTAAKAAVNAAITIYNQASLFIRTQRNNAQALFDISPDDYPREADFRTTLSQVQSALSGPATIIGTTVDLRPVFNGAANPAALFPIFSINGIAPNSFPDPIFAGIFPGRTQSSVNFNLRNFIFSYTVTDLGTLPGFDESFPNAINSAGQVVGVSEMGTESTHAFIWTAAAGMTDLGTLPGGNFSVATYINSAGQVVGFADNSGGSNRAFSWTSAGGMQNLGILPGATDSFAWGINAAGQIVGDSPGDGFDHAFRYSGGTMTDLSNLVGNSSVAEAINTSGQITGSDDSDQAFLLSGASVTHIGSLLGGDSSIGYSINNAGQVVGQVSDSFSRHAFLYSGGSVTDIDPDSFNSGAFGINNSGNIVGQDDNGAFIYKNGQAENLNDMIHGTRWDISGFSAAAYSINDNGLIVGVGGSPHGNGNHAFLLTPAASTWLAINSQPSGNFTGLGHKITFNMLVTSSAAPTYQWQRKASGSGTWANISDAGAYSGTATAVLTVNGTAAGMNGDMFRCLVTGAGKSVTSNPAFLSVDIAPEAPFFNTQPSDKTVTTGQAANFTVSAFGTPAPTYQWQRMAAGGSSFANLTNGSGFAGVTTPTLSISNTTVAMSGDQFQCLVINSEGDTITNIATLTVNQSSATVALSNLAQIYNGAPRIPTVTTNPVGLAFNLTFNGSAIPPVNVGSYAVVATITDPNRSGTVTGTLVITKSAQTITFGALTPVKVGDAPFTLGATASSGLTLTYTSSNTSVATVSGNTVTVLGKGTTTITASQTGGTNYNAAANVAQTLTVNLTPAFITQPVDKIVAAGVTATFNAAAGGTPAPTYQWQRRPAGGSSFANLTNTGNYSGVTTATLSVKGMTVAMSGDQFQCVATNAAGPATSNPATLIVRQFASTVTLSNLAQTYNGSPKSATVTTNPASLAFNITYNGSTTPPVNVGSYAVAISVTDATHAGAASSTLVIAKAPQTITFGTLAPVKIGDAPLTLGATASSGLTVTYTSSNPAVATVSGSTVTILAKGTTTITALQSGNANYKEAANVAQVLTVNQAPAITTQPTNKTVAAGVTATFTVAANGTPAPTYQWQRMVPGGSSFVNLVNDPIFSGVTTATLSVKGTTVAMSGSQFQCVATNVAGFATSNPATLTVNKAPATVTLTGLTQTYTFTPRPVTVTTVPAGLAVNVTYNGTTIVPVIPGNYAVVATVTEANHFGSANATLMIKPSASTITLSNLTQTYNGTARTATVTTSPAGLAFNITYNGSTTPPVNVGSYTVVATVTDPFSPGKPATGTLVIAKSAQTISFAALPARTVGNAPFSLGATATSNLTVTYTSSNISVATVSGSTVTLVAKGNTTITASQAGNGNYLAAANVAQVLKVNAASIASSPGGTGPAGSGGIILGAPIPHAASVVVSNVTASDDATITSFTVESADSAAWVSGIDPATTDTPSSATAADLPALLLNAMNLDASSPVEMLPTAAVETVNGISRLTLRYRQSAAMTTAQMVVQSSTDLTTWAEIPASDITPLTNADDSTLRWLASIAVPANGPVYIRLEVTPTP